MWEQSSNMFGLVVGVVPMLVTRALNNLTHKVKEESTPNPKMKNQSPRIVIKI